MADLSHVLDKIAAGSSQLYSLPVVAAKVLELTQNPQVDAREMKECIENDPALVAKVLKVVNSSLFGLSREVSDLNQALALLGIKPLKLLVLGFSLPEALFRDVEAEVLSHYWRHTLSRAVAARELSERFWNRAGDDAFIAGLLQDIGMLVLIQELGEPYLKFAARVHAEQGDVVELERATLGFDHVELTARLLTDWNMPRTLVDAIGARRRDGASAEEPLAQVLHLAELMALAIADGRAAALAELLEAANSYRMISEAQLNELFTQLEESVQQLADALSLDLSQQFDYQQLTSAAHTQLVEVSTGVAGDMVRQTAESIGVDTDGPPPFEEARSLATSVEGFRPRAEQPCAAESATATAVVDQPSKAPAAKSTAAATRSDTDPVLLARLTAGVADCRRNRCSLSLLVVELDGYPELVFHAGAEKAQEFLRQVAAACDAIDHADCVCVEIGEARLGVVLVDCDRQEAVRAGRQLIKVVHSLSAVDEKHRPSVSIGAASVAVPSPNFPPADLFTAAERCQNGVRGSGGDGLKSIEIY